MGRTLARADSRKHVGTSDQGEASVQPLPSSTHKTGTNDLAAPTGRGLKVHDKARTGEMAEPLRAS